MVWRDGPCYLAISVHGVVGDNASRDILVTDIFTAFGQRLAGEEIALQPVTTPWREWSQRCAGLAAHPAVVESRDFWLDTAAKVTLRVAGQVSEPPAVDDLVRLSSTLTVSETTEIDDARRRLQVPIDEILLAALGRTIAATVGDGSVAVDLGGPGRSVLKPDVDLRRTVGWFTTVYPVALSCANGQETSARQLLDDVHDTLKGVPHYGIGYGLLRYMYAPTARRSAPLRRLTSSSRTWARFRTCRPCASGDAPVQFDPTRRCRCVRRSRAWATPWNCGCIARLVYCIWIGGMTPADSGQATWNHLPSSLRPHSWNSPGKRSQRTKSDSASEELALVDLSSTGTDLGEANAQHR